MSVVGFDFGNSSCVIAVAQKGGIDVITNEVSSRQTPCMAAFGEKERFVGEAAATQYIRNIKNTITNVKRLIGRRYDEEDVKEELSSLPFKAVRLEDESVGVEVMYAGERRVFSITAVTGMILQKLKEITEKATTRPCNDVVIGVPGWWNERQRRAMMDAARIAGLNPLRLFNEITATALSWGIWKTNLSDTEPIHVMFYDMGESTTSVAIVELIKGKLKILSTAYDRKLGGRNFDGAIVDHFVKEFKEKYKIDIKTNPKALIRLQVACEKLKKILNSNPEAPISVDCIMNDIDVRGMMKRTDLETLFQPLLERCLEPAKKVLAETGIPVEKLFAIEISGGGTRLVPLQNKLTEFLKRDLSKTQNLEETVCKGCALQCAMLSPVFRVREFSVTDLSMYPIHFSCVGSMQTDTKEYDVFTKNNVVPSTKKITLFRREVVELTAHYSELSLLPAGTDPVLAKFVISNVPATKNESKICVKVKLDLHGMVAVDSAELVETIEEPEPMQEDKKPETEQKPEEKKEEQKTDNKKEEEKKKKKVSRTAIAINSTSFAIPQNALQPMIDEEARMVASDRLVFETAEKKNAVESYIYEMRDKLGGNLHDFATEKEKENLLKLFEATQEWLYGEGEAVTKSVYVNKLNEMKALGDPITKRRDEHENRLDAVSALRKTAEQFKLSATTEDPKYDHISAEDKKKIVDDCANAIKWLDEKLHSQDKLAKNVNPVITVAEIVKKQDEITKSSQAILNKPKPKPEPKKEEPKKEEPKPEEKKEDQKKEEPKTTEQSSDTPKPTNMDLD